MDVLSIYHIKVRISSNPLGLDEAAQKTVLSTKVFLFDVRADHLADGVLVVVSLSLQYMELANYIDSMSEI